MTLAHGRSEDSWGLQLQLQLLRGACDTERVCWVQGVMSPQGATGYLQGGVQDPRGHVGLAQEGAVQFLGDMRVVATALVIRKGRQPG